MGNTVSGKTITMRSLPFNADLKGMMPKQMDDINVNVKLSF